MAYLNIYFVLAALFLLYLCISSVLGTPMIPVHMGIMAAAPAVMVPSVPVVSKPPVPKKDLSAMRAKDEESSGPTTTVFVGNISEKASDMLIRQLLAVRRRKEMKHLR